MVVRPGGWHGQRDIGGTHHPQRGLSHDVARQVVTEADVDTVHNTGHLSARHHHHAGFKSAERHRHIGPHDGVWIRDQTRVGVDATRQIAGDDHGTTRPGRASYFNRRTAQRTLPSDAHDAVDHEVGGRDERQSSTRLDNLTAGRQQRLKPTVVKMR